MIILRNFVLKNTSSFRIDFDVIAGEDRIKSLAGGGAIDGHDYLMVVDPTGKTREFTFDFSAMKKVIWPTSTVNIVIKILDVDDHMSEWCFSKNYATELGLPSISNPQISQRTDGSRLVDIIYEYHSPNEIDPATVVVLLSYDYGKTWSIPVTSMTGDVGSMVAVGLGKRATWNPSIDLLDSGDVPISAKINLINSDGITAVGTINTGTIMIYKEETFAPTISVASDEEKTRYGKKTGNLYKNTSTNFDPIDSSSESSSS